MYHIKFPVFLSHVHGSCEFCISAPPPQKKITILYDKGNCQELAHDYFEVDGVVATPNIVRKEVND